MHEQIIDGRFAIERKVGHGGMGVVHRALDLSTGRAVALKVLHQRGALSTERFSREAALLAELRHPGIVAHVASGRLPDGALYLVMDWLEGESLERRLERGPLDLAQTLALADRLAATLAEIHRRGVIHRDLKPSNILLPAGDLASALLIDLGIARRIAEVQRLTETGQVIGSPGYLAPEQARGLVEVDARADVFALGCVLYECLSGRAPFSGGRPAVVLLRLLFEHPAPIATVCTSVPSWLGSLVDVMLAKAPEHRPPDGAGLVAALRHAQAAELPTMELVAEPASDVCTFGVLVAALEAADSTAATRSEGEHAAHLASVKAEVDRCGARLENLLDGSTLAVLAGRSAADAIACARVLRAHHPDQPILVAQGASTGAMSAALERALVAQERGELEALFAPPAPGQRRPPDAIGIADGMAAALTGALTPLRDAQGAYLSGVETGVRLAPPDAPDGQ